MGVGVSYERGTPVERIIGGLECKIALVEGEGESEREREGERERQKSEREAIERHQVTSPSRSTRRPTGLRHGSTGELD